VQVCRRSDVLRVVTERRSTPRQRLLQRVSAVCRRNSRQRLRRGPVGAGWSPTDGRCQHAARRSRQLLDDSVHVLLWSVIDQSIDSLYVVLTY